MHVSNQARRVPHSHLNTHLITGQDWEMFLLVGIIIGCKKCSEICDNLLKDEDNMLDVRNKGSDSRSIPIGMTPQTLIFLMGKKGVHKRTACYLLPSTSLETPSYASLLRELGFFLR
uniref:Uncharacterized protein n=1 Tax=Malurus cyaneus samueli TaxID=2593467 RepID=A0A8C5TW70_9PASS